MVNIDKQDSYIIAESVQVEADIVEMPEGAANNVEAVLNHLVEKIEEDKHEYQTLLNKHAEERLAQIKAIQDDLDNMEAFTKRAVDALSTRMADAEKQLVEFRKEVHKMIDSNTELNQTIKDQLKPINIKMDALSDQLAGAARLIK